ncbi:MAG: hypothetical protein ACOZHQ_05825 [Thermodesulfobacteriota bacterium]
MGAKDERDNLARLARAALMTITAGRLAALALAAGQPAPPPPRLATVQARDGRPARASAR